MKILIDLLSENAKRLFIDVLQEGQIVNVDPKGMGVSSGNTPSGTCGSITARERQIFKVCEPFKVRVGGKQDFSAPDRAIGAVSGPVEGKSDHASVFQAIISHTGSNVCMMMLHTHVWNIQLRTSGVFGRKVIWV